MKFLVIQTAYIGDVILATAVLEKLHQFYPDSTIDILVRKGNESLFEAHPFINEVIIWKKKTGKYQNLFSLLNRIRATHYNYVINLHRFFSSGFLAGFSGAAKIIGFNKNPLSFLFDQSFPHVFDLKSKKLHEIDRNLSLITSITDGQRVLPKLYPPSNPEILLNLSHPYICIAPAAVWFTKQYPMEKWIALIKLLPPDVNVYLLGGPDERQICLMIQEQIGTERVKNLAGETSLLEAAAIMKMAKMNYVNDSAPTHLASAVNAHVTTIFCSTIPEFGFSPVSVNSQVAQTKEKLACRPCGIHGKKKCPLGHFKCADIDPAEIILISGLNN